MLCNVAPYFKAALDGEFKEAKDKVLLLPEENATMFKRFQLWVYTNKILAEGEDENAIEYQTLADLYIFGDIRGIPDLQNGAMDTIIDKKASEKTIPAYEFRFIYKNSVDGSPLRRLCVD